MPDVGQIPNKNSTTNLTNNREALKAPRVGQRHKRVDGNQLKFHIEFLAFHLAWWFFWRVGNEKQPMPLGNSTENVSE